MGYDDWYKIGQQAGWNEMPEVCLRPFSKKTFGIMIDGKLQALVIFTEPMKNENLLEEIMEKANSLINPDENGLQKNAQQNGQVEMRRHGRFWSLYYEGKLLGVVVYKKGAETIKELIEKLQGEIDLLRIKDNVRDFETTSPAQMIGRDG